MTVDAVQRLSAALSDRYRIERELGRGGMATVYLAHDLKHDRPVALKVLHPDLAASLGVERFLSEIKVTANLQHPNILALFDSGEIDGFLFYVMPFVEGETLRGRLDREKQLPVAHAVRIATDVANALDYAHRQGVIHRDIKPENVLLHHETALVADFGIALAASRTGDRLTEAGLSLGTPHYMSPEQATGEREITAAADIYALGVMTFEMLAGEPPFTGPTAQAIIAKTMTEEPHSLQAIRRSVPPAVDAAVRTALEKLPADRQPSAHAFAAALGSAPAPASGAAARRRTRRLVGTAAGLVLVATGAVLLLARIGRRAPNRGHSIAVMLFRDLSPDSNDQYFSEGMSEELSTALSKVEGLQVAARTSAFSFAGRKVQAKEIGRELGVTNLLDGTVRRAGSRLRVSAQLINASTGIELWSDEYERDVKDVFAVQDEITRAIVGALRVRLGAGATVAMQRRVVSPAAHDLYLQGRFFYEKRDEAGLRRAQQFFQQAIAIDSNYALAYAGLADTYSFLAGFGFEPPRKVFPLAHAAVSRALDLDSNAVEPHTSLGFIHLFYDWDWPGADRELRKALAIDSTYSPAWLFHAWYNIAIGRTDAAMNDVLRARAADPLSLIINTRVATIQYYQRRHSEAVQSLQRALALDPGYGIARAELVRNLVQLHRCTEGLSQPDNHSDRLDVFRNYAIAFCGNLGEARRIVDSLSRRARVAYVDPYSIATTYVGLGDRDSAFAWLERSVTGRSWQMFTIIQEPLFDGIRHDPRFAQLVREVGLP